MLKVFAQQMLWHSLSYGNTSTIKVLYTLLLNSSLDFAYNNAINRCKSQELKRLTSLKLLIVVQPYSKHK